MNLEDLNRLSKIDLTTLEGNEQNVKYNIIIRFLKNFGYDQLDLEHAAQGSRIDINISNKIIIETKALDKNLNNYISQVQEYCSIERPNLALLTNGRIFRFYSPFMRVPSFADTLIYELQLSDFSNVEICSRINKIIGIENFSNGTYLTYIEERESELKQIRNSIEDYDKRNSADVEVIQSEIEQLKSEITKFESEVKRKQQEIEQIKNKKSPEKEDLYAKYFIPNTSISILTPTLQARRVITQPIVTNDNKIYIIDNPKKSVKAKGKYYDTDKFTVLSGSTVSTFLDESFGKSAAVGAYELRKNLEQTGIINFNREFVEDYTFNSIGQAACVVVGGSRNGKTEWK